MSLIQPSNSAAAGWRVRQTRVQSWGMSESRPGLRGTEDLSGGLKAVCTLESGIDLDDGTYLFLETS